MRIDSNSSLAPWQQNFVDQFLRQKNSKSLLVAAPGTGKTATALFAANEMLSRSEVDSLLVISDRLMIRDQWSHVAARYGIDLGTSLESYLDRNGASATLQSLWTRGAAELIEEAARARRWFIMADDPAYETKSLVSLVDRMLSLNNSKALFISQHLPTGLSVDSEFHFASELILERSILDAPPTEVRIARFAPSFSLLQQLQKGSAAIDGMSWREFEKFIASLLENDGYVVDLMKGSKDGGVDVIAVKDLGPNGYFKALWQAKKQTTSNKVGISVVRELADTRQEFGASKGIIVTSSYLTKGALERVNRDKYLLGKVDRKDLDA
ncbi:restriction endonuclease [Dyella tabacisoli]|uniref:Restriction endonuclease n=1 Tax=Dyella tabacisoli TaxID=2282381 RepID=A0A369UI01_9GAMM|nr:restriction endonuclease [Dyella tabacisoli]RDD80382.1 hypothetical protein DVJ77_17230 [Dyella tabacisoli]